MSEIKRWHPDNCGMVRHGDKSWEPEYDHNLSGLPYVRSDDYDAAERGHDAAIAALVAACNIMCNALQRIEAGEPEPRMIARRTLEHWSEKSARSSGETEGDAP